MTYETTLLPADRKGITTDRILAWLTIERLAWIVVGLVAAAARLAGLGYRPFDSGEAQQAVAALASAMPAPGVSPLLLSVQRIAFVLLEANEPLARVWPALAGVVLVLLALELRPELGRVGALAAGGLLAVSPLLVFWSRSATGESVALLAAMILIVALARARRGMQWVVWAAVGLALLVLSAPIGYGALVLLAPMAVLALAGRPATTQERVSEGGSQWLVGLLVFGGIVLLGATALFFNLAGFAAVADLPVAWLAGLTTAGGYSPFWLLAQVTLGETLALAAGIAGLVIGLRRRNWLAEALGLWLLLGLVLLILRSGRTPADAALLALPLALLAGIAVEAFVAQFSVSGQAAEVAVLLVVSIVVLGAMAIWLADYARSLVDLPRPVFLFSAATALVVLLAIFAAYAVVFGVRVTWQVAAVVAFVVLGLLTARMTALTSHNHDAQRWGTVADDRGARDGQNLAAFLERLAAQRGTDLRDLPVALVAAPGSEASPLLHWLVRDARTRVAAGAAAADPGDVFVSMADDPPPAGSDPAAPLVGRSFRITEHWSPGALNGAMLWKWLLFGEFGQPAGEQRAVVWLPAGSGQ